MSKRTIPKNSSVLLGKLLVSFGEKIQKIEFPDDFEHKDLRRMFIEHCVLNDVSVISISPWVGVSDLNKLADISFEVRPLEERMARKMTQLSSPETKKFFKELLIRNSHLKLVGDDDDA